MKTNGFPFGLVSITLDYLSLLVDNYFGSLHLQQLFHMLVVCVLTLPVENMCYERSVWMTLNKALNGTVSTWKFNNVFLAHSFFDEQKWMKWRKKVLIHPILWVHCHHISGMYEFQSGGQCSFDLLLFVTIFTIRMQTTSHQIPNLNIWWAAEYMLGARAAAKFTIFEWTGKNPPTSSPTTTAARKKTIYNTFRVESVECWANVMKLQTKRKTSDKKVVRIVNVPDFDWFRLDLPVIWDFSI